MLEDLAHGVLENLRTKGTNPFTDKLCQKILRYAQYDYTRTMNKMIFINHMTKTSNKMLYKKVAVPESERIFMLSKAAAMSNGNVQFTLPAVCKNRGETKDQGKMETWLTKDKFDERLSRVKLHTLYVQDEVVQTVIKIKKICEDLEKNCI